MGELCTLGWTLFGGTFAQQGLWVPSPELELGGDIMEPNWAITPVVNRSHRACGSGPAGTSSRSSPGEVPRDGLRDREAHQDGDLPSSVCARGETHADAALKPSQTVPASPPPSRPGSRWTSSGDILQGNPPMFPRHRGGHRRAVPSTGPSGSSPESKGKNSNYDRGENWSRGAR